MQEIGLLIPVFFVGVFVSFIGSIVSGAGLLTLSFLIFIGLPPQVAIATDRFGALGVASASLLKYGKNGKVVWKYVLPLSVLSFGGSLIGANVLLKVDSAVVEPFIGVMLLLLLPFLFVKKDLGLKAFKADRWKMILGSIFYFLIQIFTGFLGAGTGPFIFYILMTCFGLTIIQSVATQTLPFLVLSLSSTIIFAYHGLIDYQIAFALLSGTICGGYLGAHIAIKKGNTWVKGLFAIVIMILAFRFLLK